MQPIPNLSSYTQMLADWVWAVLYQRQDGMDRVIAYATRTLSKSEKNYSVHKLEFLELKCAVKHTDNKTLTYILTSAKIGTVGQ